MKKIENLKKIVSQQPKSSGIYQMVNEEDKILYVGKAKNIQNRLKSYLNPNNLSNRIRRLMSQVKKIDVIITETEKEALLLEANLIKKIKPQYNILSPDASNRFCNGSTKNLHLLISINRSDTGIFSL